MPEEVGFFGRTAAYGLFIAAVYWFVSYEVAGTVLLAGFGLATGVGFVLLLRRHRSGEREAREAGGSLRTDAPFSDESGAVPLRSFAPLELGVGVTILGLGLVFGIWFVILAIVPLAAGSFGWIRAARREHDLVEARDSRVEGSAPRDASGQARADPAAGDRTAR
jgi:hypothetical protein